MAYVSKIQAPDGTIHEFEFESEPSEDTVKDLVTTVNSEWGSWGQESFDTLPSAFARGATQSAASLVEGVGDISGSDTLSQTGRDLKDSAAATFPVDPAREDEFATKAAGVVGQGLEQAAELLVPISKFGRASRVVQGAGYGSAAIKGADAGEDVARQFGVDDDPVKRAALMAGYGLAEVGSELIGGLGPEKAIGELLGGQLSEAGYRAVGKGILTEGLEEGASQVGQNSLTRSIITEDEAKAAGQDLPDYFDDVLESIALGGIAGGALSAPRLLGTAQAADQAAAVADVTSPQADTPEGLTAAVKATEATLEGRMTEIVDPRGPFIQEDQAPEDLTGQELLPPVAEPELIQPNEEIEGQRQEEVLTEVPPLAELVSQEEIPNQVDGLDVNTAAPEDSSIDGDLAGGDVTVLRESDGSPPDPVITDGQEALLPTEGSLPDSAKLGITEAFPTEGPRVVTGAEIIANAKPGDSIVLGNGDSVTVETLTPEGTAVLSSPKYGQQVIATDQSIPVAQEFLRPGKTGASTSVLAQGSAISEPVAKRISKDLSLAMKRIGFPGNVDIRFVGENDVISEEDTRASRTLKGIKGVRVDGPSKSIIYLNRDLLTADTPVHELMHGYVPAVKQQRPDLYDEGVKLLESNQDYLRAVRSLYPEGITQDQLYEEAMVSALGIEGAKLWESTSKNKEWVKAFRRFVARLKLWLDGKLRSLGMKSDMTLGEWAKLRNLEIFAGKKVLPETQGSMGNPTDVQERTEKGDIKQGWPTITPPPSEEVSIAALPDTASAEDVAAAAPQQTQAAISMASGVSSYEEWAKKIRAAFPSIYRFAKTIWESIRSISISIVVATTGSSSISTKISRPQIGTIPTKDLVSLVSSSPIIAEVDVQEAPKTQEPSEVIPPEATPRNVESPESLQLKTSKVTSGAGIDSLVLLPMNLQREWLDNGRKTPSILAAEPFMGQREGHNEVLAQIFRHYGIKESQDQYPWCATFISFAISKSGSPTKIFNARGFLLEGEDKTSPGRGDVVVLWNSNEKTGGKRGWGGHAGLYLGETDSHVILLSGNTNDEVNVSAFHKDRVLGVRSFPSSELALKFSLDPNSAPQKPTGLGKNVRANPKAPAELTQAFEGITYQSERGSDAAEQAEGIFQEVQKDTKGWAGHVAKLDELMRTAGSGEVLNLTPGAYFGRIMQSLREVMENPRSSLAQKDSAKARMRELAEMQASQAATFGQLVKGFDVGWKLAYPELQVESAERTVTFKNEEDAKGHVRELAAILDEAFQTDKEAVAALLAKQEEAVAALQKVVGRQIRGEDTADAGAAEAEAHSTVAEQEEAADQTDKLDWIEQAFSEVRESSRVDTMTVLKELRVLAQIAAIKARGASKASLSPDFLAALEGDLAGLETMTPAQLDDRAKQANDAIASATKRLTKRSVPRKAVKKDMTAEERQEYAATQIFDTLSRMVSKKKKKGRKSNDQLIVSAIAKSLMQKAGVNVPISNEAEERAVMLGLLLANQEDAYAALEQAKTKLESDPATKDLITSEQLNAFGQLAIGREFDKDPEAGAAFGPRQVAQVLRAELETANADMRKIVMDASLANRTAETIEKQLRDPARGLETRLGKEGLDRLVSVVGSSYQKTLAERAEAERKKDGRQALSYLDKKPARIIDYLIQRKGLDLKGIEEDMNDFARQDKLTKSVADLAAKLNLSPEQTKLFMKPVVAEGMKYLDAKRKREVKARLEKKIQTAGNRKPKATELQKLTQLIELGALDEDSFSTVLLGEQGAKKFTPEFKARLTERLRKANDPATPLAEANNYRRLYSQEIEAAKGTSIMRLIGETTMAHIFGGLNTQKINFAFGGMKTWMDNASWAKATAKASGLSGAEGRAAQSAILKAATRGYAQWSREEAKYILKTGFSNATEDPALHFSNAMLEVMKGNPDTEIRATQNGKPLPASVQSVIRKAITFHPYVRRAMVASDIFHRATAWEVLKASQAVRALKESGQTFKTQQDWLNAIDELNYGPGGMKAALKDATDQAQREVNAGTLDEIRKGVRVQELMDGRMAEALGMSGPERLATLREEAKRWTLGSITPGVLGGFTELLLSANRIIPGAGLFLPAVRVPVNAMWQSLDWSPYGFLRAKIANSSQRRTESVSAYLFDREGKRYPKPASLVSDERVIDLRNKAFVGTALLGAAWAAMAAGLDDDDEKATFYITGRGPEDPTKAKDWRARGFQPYSIRIAGQDFNFRESPLYAVFAPIGAWSDAHRYGKLDDTAQERISAAAAASVRSVGDQAVLKNLIETLGFYAGGENRQGAPGDQLVKSLSRIGASVIAPNVGREVNQILYGPPNTKEQSWAGNLLANVPFVAGEFRQPAINALGDEIHEQRGGVLGETAGMLTYRISAKPVDDPQLHAVARLGINKLSTTRRTKTGEEVMDDYDLVRKWAKASGKRIREYLAPAKIAELEAARKKDQAKAEEAFDSVVKDIRTEELDRLLK